MPANKSRGEGDQKRKERLAKIKRGPGAFVYTGAAYDSECIPTYLKVGRNTPVLDDSGMPVIDGSGRPVTQRAGTLVLDNQGRPVLGGEPLVKRTRLEVFDLWGMKFPEGKSITVEDERLALKLRGMDCFEEVEPGAEPAAPTKRRGRKPKAEEGATESVAASEAPEG